MYKRQDAAIVRDPVMKDLIMVVKNENSLPAEKNLRITRTTRIELSLIHI